MKKWIELENRTILITGVAGFIGSALVIQLLKRYSNIKIIGIDNINDYYDVKIKEWRLKQNEHSVKKDNAYLFVKGDISDKSFVEEIIKKYEPSIVVSLAAQAGVRYSIENPDVYIKSNIVGFYNVLECCRQLKDMGANMEHLVYASSSSVYGEGNTVPYRTTDRVDTPVSLYAATKKSDELLAYSYSKLYKIPTTGLRFFTVYGPAGRPDMAYFTFTQKLVKNENVKVFNYGNCKRDFTYIDDVVEGIIRVMTGAPVCDCKGSEVIEPPYAIYNIGNQQPENLMEFLRILRTELVNANILPIEFDLDEHAELVPMQAGDVEVTYSDTSDLERDYEFKPNTKLQNGLKEFVEWYRDFYS